MDKSMMKSVRLYRLFRGMMVLLHVMVWYQCIASTAAMDVQPEASSTFETTRDLQTVNCNNADTARVEVKLGTRKVFRTCSFVALNRKALCNATDFNKMRPVGLTCAKECPGISGCLKPSPPVPTPTQPSAPTQPSVPTPTIPSYPPGPYIHVNTSSEVVTIPRPKKPVISAILTNCPHLQTGLKNWLSTSTWPGGIIPASNSNVTLPANTKVLINTTLTGIFGYITIPNTSELIIGSTASTVNEIQLHTKGMNVFGKLTIGSSTCRITKFVTITLYGTRPLDAITNVPAPWIKGINVDGGILSLHGQRYYNTWTRLAKTVLPGDTMIFLQEEVNWSIGQQIILVTSAMKDSRDYNRNEVLTIKQIDYNPISIGVGSVITVNEIIKYTHIANANYQVEVGLLTRNIKIQGNVLDSEPTDKDPGNCRDVDADKFKNQIYYNNTRPCVNNTELTGYGGHIMIQNGGIGQLAGVELHRMGQTNLLGRYPVHYHLLKNDCPTCFVSDSSIHRSFYRCISIHGTNLTTINENVAYDVVGHCYYLESGVEVNNTISYNLAAHIHTLGPQMIRGGGHSAPLMTQNNYNLATPVDVSASGFYILNMFNTIIGNAASGGWAGYTFPLLTTPLDVFRNESIRPSNSMTLVFDGNTGHSTGWWWRQASPFYSGSTLRYNALGLLEYDPGRSKSFFRNTCIVNPCYILQKDCGRCNFEHRGWLRFTNTKSFLSAGIGFNSWHGRVEILGYETHDVRLAFQAISTTGLWLDNMLAVCRTGTILDLPANNANWLEANGITWYDINQKHIVTDSKFRNCGYRSDQFNQYDISPTRGCDSNTASGCDNSSRTFGFLTSSDIFTPQIMTATRNITFDNCGRRFWMEPGNTNTVSGRGQNWLDFDGTISGLKEPTLIGSGVNSVKDWWGVDDEVVLDVQAPIRFIKKNNGPQREMAYTQIFWDSSLHDQVGITLCSEFIPCPAEGYVRHAGKKFTPSANVTPGMPLTAKASVNGLSGGFGWIVDFNKTAPRHIDFVEMEIAPDSNLLISIPYPIGTTFNVTAKSEVCSPVVNKLRCTEIFTKVSTMDLVRNGAGNTYFVDSNGVLTFRLAQIRFQDVGNPNWALPNYTTPAYFSRDMWALWRFERDGVLLPMLHDRTGYQIQAKCPSDSGSSPLDGYCPELVPDYNPDVCLAGYVQVAYDKCCQISDKTKCMFSDGSKNFS